MPREKAPADVELERKMLESRKMKKTIHATLTKYRHVSRLINDNPMYSWNKQEMDRLHEAIEHSMLKNDFISTWLINDGKNKKYGTQLMEAFEGICDVNDKVAPLEKETSISLRQYESRHDNTEGAKKQKATRTEVDTR